VTEGRAARIAAATKTPLRSRCRASLLFCAGDCASIHHGTANIAPRNRHQLFSLLGIAPSLKTSLSNSRNPLTHQARFAQVAEILRVSFHRNQPSCTPGALLCRTLKKLANQNILRERRFALPVDAGRPNRRYVNIARRIRDHNKALRAIDKFFSRRVDHFDQVPR